MRRNETGFVKATGPYTKNSNVRMSARGSSRSSSARVNLPPMTRMSAQGFALALPWRPLLGKLAVGLLLTVSFALIILSKTDSQIVRNLRAGLNSVMVPVIDTALRPMDAVHDFSEWVGSFAHMRAENIALKTENAELLRWQLVARQMEAENKSLRTLMQFANDKALTYTTARIVTDSAGPFVRTALINVGGNDNVLQNEAVVSERGLVGRIVDTGPNSSRVLLITDINSRVPVMTELAREKSVLSGNNTDLPQLNYLPDDTKVQVGERVVTAGDGKLLPAGLPVGVIKSIESGIVKVQPLVDWSRLEIVSIAHQ